MLMIIACLTMLIDHIGGHILEIPAMRIIGRIAMPVYAYLIVGSFEHTCDRKKYMNRMLRTALVSQIPFMIMISSLKLNICFTWVLSILVLMCAESIENDLKKKKYLSAVTVISNMIVILLVSCLVPMDYGIFAVMWVILFYVRSRSEKMIGNTVLIIGAAVNYCVWGVSVQFAGLLAVPIIFFCERHGLVRLKNRFAAEFYRIFYPLHMTIIDICKLI